VGDFELAKLRILGGSDRILDRQAPQRHLGWPLVSHVLTVPASKIDRDVSGSTGSLLMRWNVLQSFHARDKARFLGMNDGTLESFARENLSDEGWMLRTGAEWLISAHRGGGLWGNTPTDRTELGAK
jgi:hypothetical protein